MRDVGPKDPLQVSSPEDQGPVQALGPDRAHPAFAQRVGVRAPDRSEEKILVPSDRNTSSKGPVNLVSGRGSKNLGDGPFSCRPKTRFRPCWATPRRIRVGRRSAEMHLPRPELDPHQHVQGLQRDGLHGEEVAR